ncbi:hypothetical protein EGR_07175 [Echinococcus granulosus]|uniref:Uncharacterized protein n=1 Tax=Echinococcus granulosus TaxID=6210 RepID=W6U9E1_ECHGR|nr:hypothetical protein EGR_07175 [Echinococcus granulosus]EUB57983.1 hypothetical protein EGR_07175 [Echinococcus granulosus]
MPNTTTTTATTSTPATFWPKSNNHQRHYISFSQSLDNTFSPVWWRWWWLLGEIGPGRIPAPPLMLQRTGAHKRRHVNKWVSECALTHKHHTLPPFSSHPFVSLPPHRLTYSRPSFSAIPSPCPTATKHSFWQAVNTNNEKISL